MASSSATCSTARPFASSTALTAMGRELEPALSELKAWAQQWLREDTVAAGARHSRRRQGASA